LKLARAAGGTEDCLLDKWTNTRTEAHPERTDRRDQGSAAAVVGTGTRQHHPCEDS